MLLTHSSTLQSLKSIGVLIRFNRVFIYSIFNSTRCPEAKRSTVVKLTCIRLCWRKRLSSINLKSYELWWRGYRVRRSVKISECNEPSHFGDIRAKKGWSISSCNLGVLQIGLLSYQDLVGIFFLALNFQPCFFIWPWLQWVFNLFL
jgi:hypothetical protein